MATTNPMKEYWRNQQKKVTATPATDTSKLFRMPEEKSHLNSGHYYRKDGTWLFTIEKNEDVYIYKEEEQNTDIQKIINPIYSANFNTADYSTSFINEDFVRLENNITDLQKFAYIAWREERTNKEGTFAIASSVMNFLNEYNLLNPSKISKISQILNNEFGFTSVKSKLFINNDDIKKKNAFGAAINAILGGFDFSNGATHWDGFDFCRGTEHPKVKNQGVEITNIEHINGMKNYWTTEKLKAISGGKYLSFKELNVQKYPSTEGLTKLGRVLFKSSAQYGGTIFWTPNKTALENEDYNWNFLYKK